MDDNERRNISQVLFHTSEITALKKILVALVRSAETSRSLL